jgi:hypothetical protein
MQVRTVDHTSRPMRLREGFERAERRLDRDDKRFYELFQESTFEGSQAAAQKMKKYAKRQNKRKQNGLLFHSLHFLVYSDSEMLSWPNSPLLVLLQFVDPNMLFGDGAVQLEEVEDRVTLLHHLAALAAPSTFSTHQNQVILAKQLIQHGANVNAVSTPRGLTPLHHACFAGHVTNLDFVELLLEAGADPNAQGDLGLTPLLCTTPDTPGAAKFLLNWPATNANITSRSEKPFLVWVRKAVKNFSDEAAAADQVCHEFMVQQWREIEEMLVEREATDTGIAAIE